MPDTAAATAAIEASEAATEVAEAATEVAEAATEVAEAAAAAAAAEVVEAAGGGGSSLADGAIEIAAFVSGLVAVIWSGHVSDRIKHVDYVPPPITAPAR